VPGKQRRRQPNLCVLPTARSVRTATGKVVRQALAPLSWALANDRGSENDTVIFLRPVKIGQDTDFRTGREALVG